MAFSSLCLAFTGFFFLLLASPLSGFGILPAEVYRGRTEKYSDSIFNNVESLQKEIENVEFIIKEYNTSVKGAIDRLKMDQYNIEILQKNLETRATKRSTTITEFVKCLNETSEDYYLLVTYRSLAYNIRNVTTSYGGFFDIKTQDNPLWNKSLNMGDKLNLRQPLDFTVCDKHLSIERTEETDDLRGWIEHRAKTEVDKLTSGEIMSIYENVLKNMQNKQQALS
ncbi:unnamed protein product [Trichobilharzia szidati]|nr:unnamed protein product [Trichobilharzia szidati]